MFVVVLISIGFLFSPAIRVVCQFEKHIFKYVWLKGCHLHSGTNLVMVLAWCWHWLNPACTTASMNTLFGSIWQLRVAYSAWGGAIACRLGWYIWQWKSFTAESEPSIPFMIKLYSIHTCSHCLTHSKRYIAKNDAIIRLSACTNRAITSDKSLKLLQFCVLGSTTVRLD